MSDIFRSTAALHFLFCDIHNLREFKRSSESLKVASLGEEEDSSWSHHWYQQVFTKTYPILTYPLHHCPALKSLLTTEYIMLKSVAKKYFTNIKTICPNVLDCIQFQDQVF